MLPLDETLKAIDHASHQDDRWMVPQGEARGERPHSGRYQLQEMRSKDYLRRTEQNIIDSDATVIFTCSATLTGGSKRTAEVAVKHRKPVLHVRATESMAVTVEAGSGACVCRCTRKFRFERGRLQGLERTRSRLVRPRGALQPIANPLAARARKLRRDDAEAVEAQGQISAIDGPAVGECGAGQRLPVG